MKRVFWFTGVSGSGKSSIANALRNYYGGTVVDSDHIRLGLSSDLTFTREDKREQARRLAHVANLVLKYSETVYVCCISPYKEDRDMAAQIVGEPFELVYIKCPISAIIARHPDNLYDAGVTDLPGYDAPYQEPDENENFVVYNYSKSVKDAVIDIVKHYNLWGESESR